MLHRCTGATTHPLIETHREELLSIARRRGMTNVRVFGSMARGDAHDDSDVDLLVTLVPGATGLALRGLLFDAQELLGRRVDVVTDQGLHPAMRPGTGSGDCAVKRGPAADALLLAHMRECIARMATTPEASAGASNRRLSSSTQSSASCRSAGTHGGACQRAAVINPPPPR